MFNLGIINYRHILDVVGANGRANAGKMEVLFIKRQIVHRDGQRLICTSVRWYARNNWASRVKWMQASEMMSADMASTVSTPSAAPWAYPCWMISTMSTPSSNCSNSLSLFINSCVPRMDLFTITTLLN